MRIIFIMCALCISALGSDTYFAATSAGSNNGTSCANAYAYNDGTHGLGVAGTWVGDAVLHLCGTFTGTAGTTLITAQGSGTSGHPITLKFETGAILQAPYWSSSGAVVLNNKSFITVDGGSNGVIQNTANGTNLANQQLSLGLSAASTSNVEIKNLTIQNIYINAGSAATATDRAGDQSKDIDFSGTPSHILIHNNTLTNAWAGVFSNFGSLDTISVYNNTISDHCQGVTVGAGSGGETTNNVQIYNNTITDWWNWQCPAAATYCTGYDGVHELCHTDGIILYQPSTNSTAFAPLVYSNYIYGDLGQGSATGFVYCTYGGIAGGSNGTSCNIFNNLLVQIQHAGRTTSNGPWALVTGTSTSNHVIVNNTVAGWASSGSFTAGIVDSSSGDRIENNLYENFGHAFETYWLPDPTAAVTNWTEDYNIWFNVSQAGASQWAANQNNGHFYSYATWQGAGYGYDAHSLTADPLLLGSYTPNVGSPAIHAGTNLTSLCSGNLTALCTDKAGASRPASGAWDIGAYQFTGAVSSSFGTGVALGTGIGAH